MSVYFAQGAWWTTNGQAFATEQEATQAEAAGTPNNSTNAVNSAAFNAVPNVRGAVDGTPLAAAIAAQRQQDAAAQQAKDAAQIASAPYDRARKLAPITGIDPNTGQPYTGMERPSTGSFLNDALSTAKKIATVAANPIGEVGKALFPKAAPAFDALMPVNALAAAGTKELGSAAQSAVQSLYPSATGTGGGGAAPNRNVAGAGTQLPSNIAVPNYSDIATQAAQVAPRANTAASDQSRAQQDALIQQLTGVANQQSALPTVDTTGYNQSRATAQNVGSALSALANNNIPVTGLNGAQFNQQLGTSNQITGQLQGQANNNVADIQANAAQRDATRNALMGTANTLLNTKDINNVFADTVQRNQDRGQLSDIINKLQGNADNKIGDIQVDPTQYNQSRDQQNSIIQQLISAAQAPEGPSAAEALALQGQERAERNAFGNAASVGGGWRSQLVAGREAQAQAAQGQQDAAANSAALRAQENANYRTQLLQGLTNAGGLAGTVGGQDLQLGTTNAGLREQVAALNQANSLNSLNDAATQGQGLLGSDTGFSLGQAGITADIEKANQLNRLNAQLGAGQLQQGALVSDTGLAQSNAALLAQVRQGNQANALNSLAAAGNVAGNSLNAANTFANNDAQQQFQRQNANQQNSLAAQIAASNNANNLLQSDRTLATANADRQAQVDQNNKANSIAALSAAGVISNTTRGQDIQLSQGDQQALVQTAMASAQLSGSVFASQLTAAVGMANVQARQAELAALKSQYPKEWQKLLAASGQVAGLIGLLA